MAHTVRVESIDKKALWASRAVPASKKVSISWEDGAIATAVVIGVAATIIIPANVRGI